MTGYRHSDQSNGNKPPEGGKQRLKQPGSTRPEAEQEQPAAAPRRRSSSLLSNHWGKVALGTAAAVLVGGPLLVSHVQMNKEHPEFSPLSMQGMAQRVIAHGIIWARWPQPYNIVLMRRLSVCPTASVYRAARHYRAMLWFVTIRNC